MLAKLLLAIGLQPPSVLLRIGLSLRLVDGITRRYPSGSWGMRHVPGHLAMVQKVRWGDFDQSRVLPRVPKAPVGDGRLP